MSLFYSMFLFLYFIYCRRWWPTCTYIVTLLLMSYDMIYPFNCMYRGIICRHKRCILVDHFMHLINPCKPFLGLSASSSFPSPSSTTHWSSFPSFHPQGLMAKNSTSRLYAPPALSSFIIHHSSLSLFLSLLISRLSVRIDISSSCSLFLSYRYGHGFVWYSPPHQIVQFFLFSSSSSSNLLLPTPGTAHQFLF